jgi:hypothetical protein
MSMGRLAPNLNLKAEIVPAGATLIDTDTALTLSSIKAIKAVRPDIKGVIRYVGLSHPDSVWNITGYEAEIITGAGWGLMLVQHCPWSFMPSVTLGEAYGTAAANNALAVGYPARASLWCDLENYTISGELCIRYVNEWCGIVRYLGYFDGVYPGLGKSGIYPLSPNELYYSLITTRYWQPASSYAPAPVVRGPCMRQQLTTTIAGVAVDLNIVEPDEKGDLPAWAVAA